MSGPYDATGRDGDVTFARQEVEPGIFRITARRGERERSRLYRCLHFPRFGLDAADLAAMDEIVGELVAELRSGEAGGEAPAGEETEP